MKERNLYFTILIFLILFTTFFGIILLNGDNVEHKNNNNNADIDYINNEVDPKSSNGALALNQTLIFQNTSAIRRGFESINFTVNVSDFLPYANNVTMQISFSNNTDGFFNMTKMIGTTDNFTVAYTPSGKAPLGLQVVRFIIYNISWDELNDQTTQRSFIIKSNSMVNFNSSEYFRGEYLLADMNDISDDFTWILSVVNSTNESQQNELFGLGENVLQVYFEINESFNIVNQYYYIKVELTELSTSKLASEYFKFDVQNRNPLIIPTSVKFNPTTVFRTDTCVVTLNVSDIEYSGSQINVMMFIEDPNGNMLPNVPLETNENGKFTDSFSIKANRPAGFYRITFEAKDPLGDIGEYSTNLTVKNNPPEIDGYEINDNDNDERISVLYGEDLVFEFDVFDIEGLAYVTVKLIDQDDEDFFNA